MLQYDSSLIIGALEEVKLHRPNILKLFSSSLNLPSTDLLSCLNVKTFNLMHQEEIKDLLDTVNSVVFDIGFLNGTEIEIIKNNINCFLDSGKPIIFDPSGVDVSEYRNKMSKTFLETMPIKVLRGNCSEIIALENYNLKISRMSAEVKQETVINSAKSLAKKYNIIVVASGSIDYITDGDKFIAIKNGDSILGKITGTGYALSCLIAAFISSIHGKDLLATTSAVSLLAISGQIAAMKSSSIGSFKSILIDVFDSLTVREIQKNIKFIDFSKILQH